MLACNNKITKKKEIDGLAVFSGTHTKLMRLVNDKKISVNIKTGQLCATRPSDHDC